MGRLSEWYTKRVKKLPIFLVFLFLFIFPSGILAGFSGGINIGDHYSEIDNAANVSNGTGWVYVIMNPDNASQLAGWLNKYPNLQVIVRGHVPDQKGSSLTSEYAQRWANVFKNLPRAIYFMPVNEPNNPSESNGGIPAATVVSYITSLTNAINNTAGAKEKVILLSPAIDVYTLSDRGSSYINELGGWAFFSQFYGIALNLYGEYVGSSINSNAPPIKRGEGYREFLKSHFGASETQANSIRIFAVETGVKKVGENVKYQENTSEIIDYLNRMKGIWGSDPNFIMHAIFSYDPVNNANPPWIYTETAVLAAMGLTGGTTSVIASPTPELEDFQKEYEITQNANKRLLPKSIQDVIAQKETNNCALNILGICFIGRSTKEKLVVQTEHFQPVFVTKDKVVSAERNCENLGCVINNVIKNLFGLVVPPQVEVKETGSLNAFRPQNLEFSQINNQTAQDNSNQNVLAATVAPLTEEERVKNTYKFTQKMLLPRSIGNLIVQAPTNAPLPGTPAPTLPPGVTPTPTGAHYGTCREGTGYCSVEYLKQYFPSEAIARQASIICNKESGSNPFVANKGCLTGRYVDYSIGLFQINLLAHCPGAFSSYTWNPPSCVIGDRQKLRACETRLYDPDTNIRDAVSLSANGANWGPWSSARVCGIIR